MSMPRAAVTKDSKQALARQGRCRNEQHGDSEGHGDCAATQSGGLGCSHSHAPELQMGHGHYQIHGAGFVASLQNTYIGTHDAGPDGRAPVHLQCSDT